MKHSRGSIVKVEVVNSDGGDKALWIHNKKKTLVGACGSTGHIRKKMGNNKIKYFYAAFLKRKGEVELLGEAYPQNW